LYLIKNIDNLCRKEPKIDLTSLALEVVDGRVQEREGVAAAGQAAADRQVPGHHAGLQLPGTSAHVHLSTGASISPKKIFSEYFYTCKTFQFILTDGLIEQGVPIKMSVLRSDCYVGWTSI
jgi:hypothetical protein